MTDNTQPEAREFTMSQYASKDDMIGAMRERIAELESELEAVGAGGVQALGAAPAVLSDEAILNRTGCIDYSPGTAEYDLELIRWYRTQIASPAPSAAAVEAVEVYEQKENEMQVWFRPARMHGHPERTPIKATITKDRGNGIVDLTYDDGEFSGNARAVPNALRLPRNVREQVAVWWDVGFEMDFQTAVDNSLKKKKNDPPPQPSPTPPAEQTFITPETGNSVSAKGAAITSESPTPPAEQQAQPGAVYAELPQPDSWFHFTAQFWENKLRDFADRTHALRMEQAAPKAAQGEPVNGWPVKAKIYKRRDEWVLELSGVINDCAFTCRHTQPGYLQPEDVAGLPSIYSEGTAPQPAPQGETSAQLDTDSNSPTPGQQRDVAGPMAVGQPVGHGSDSTAGDPSAQRNKLLTVAERNIRSFLRSAVFKSESDREAALNCVDVLWEAARAPAEPQAAPKAAPGDVLDEALRERDDAEDFIDALLDEVLGHERPEWSSSYGRADALNDVQERMTALHKPAVDKAWGRFQSAMAAPQQEAQEPVSPRHPVVMQWRDNAIEACAKIADAYGNEQAAQDMRVLLTAPQPAPAPLSDDVVKDAARYRWLREGNDAKHGAAWHVAVNLYGCEWDAAIDAALAAQGGKV